MKKESTMKSRMKRLKGAGILMAADDAAGLSISEKMRKQIRQETIGNIPVRQRSQKQTVLEPPHLREHS